MASVTTPIGQGMVSGVVHGKDSRITVRGGGDNSVHTITTVLFRLHVDNGESVVQVEARGPRMSGALNDGDFVTVVKGKWLRGDRVLRAKTMWNHTVGDSVYVTIFRPRER
jgi:hypothetical protein